MPPWVDAPRLRPERLIAAGYRNRAIADRLSISEGTVKVHVHVNGRIALTRYAREDGLA